MAQAASAAKGPLQKLRQGLRRLAQGLKFRHKMILVSTGCVLFVGVVSIAGYQISLREYAQALYRQTSFSMRLFSRQILFEMETIEELSFSAAHENGVQQNLLALGNAGATDLERHLARSTLTQAMYQYLAPEVRCITLLPLDGVPIRCGLDSSPESEAVMAQAQAGTVGRGGAVFWMVTDREDGSVLLVREVRKKNDPGFLQSLGYLIFRVDYEMLIRQTGTGINVLDNQLLAIADNGGDVFLSTFGEGDFDHRALALEKGQDYDVREVAGQRLFITQAALKTTDPALTITSGIPYGDLFATITRSQVFTLLAMLLAIVLAILAAALVVRSINSRFVLLVAKINRFAAGDMAPAQDTAGYGSDEFGLLNRHFDALAVELKTMIEDNYVKQLLITQAQLRNLENQIHPHFLYNTLETVSWFAKRRGEENIPVIVDALSTLLRSSLSQQEDVVSLEQELALLDSYITIQKIRYTDMLQIEFDIAPDTLAARIPKMSIQPLVENAITYSMEESIDGCLIRLASSRTADGVVVRVENNGSQIDEDILEKLKTNAVRANGNGIGLANIDARLRLIFGEGYGLRFINGEDSVTVEIHLPGGTENSSQGEETHG